MMAAWTAVEDPLVDPETGLVPHFQVPHHALLAVLFEVGLSSDNYFSRSATIRIPDRPCTEQGVNDNYFSRSGRQSGLPIGAVSGYVLRAG
jgi:hypothetical protein